MKTRSLVQILSCWQISLSVWNEHVFHLFAVLPWFDYESFAQIMNINWIVVAVWTWFHNAWDRNLDPITAPERGQQSRHE